MTLQRYAAVIALRDEHSLAYRELHRHPWPGVLAALKRAHVSNYSIFVRDGYLFSYMEYGGEDFAADMANIAADPETQRWWELTNPCQRRLDTAAPDEWWAPAEELFHLD